MGEPTVEVNRWRARPVMAGAIAVAVFATPVLCSIGVAGLLGYVWGSTTTTGGTVLRWSVVLIASTLVFVGCERLTRRALPLSVLLKMGMVFPGRAPKRLSVARRTWTTRDLSRRIDEARDRGISDEPTAAAEQIVALAATLGAHDRKTRGHAERVRAFTDLIAEELRLPDGDRDRLRWSALLHDVGKLAVHSEVLNKPGALSDSEWEMMRQHPLEGARLTAPLAPWLGPWANTIAEHHERFDGRGYPFGLAGQEISTGGRIVAVADCYDTMTSLRSYKKPMSAEAARAELAACAGTHFDPVMVRAFLGVSVSRLHAVAPLSWIGSLPFGNFGPQLARLASTGGRLGTAGVAATVGVVGLAAGQQAVASPPRSHLSATDGGASSSGGSTSSPGRGGAVGPGHPAGDGSGARTGPSGTGSSSGHPHPGTSTTLKKGTHDPGSAGAGASGGASDGAGPAGSDPGTTITTGSGTVPSVPTTTVGHGPPGSTTTTSTTATSTTTTTTPPPPVAPGGLSVTSDCQALILLPEAKLRWTASPSSGVTGYVILRGTTKTGSYSSVGTVNGRATVSYTDRSVSGLGTTYWYKVEAVAGGQSAVSAAASTTTPGLCL